MNKKNDRFELLKKYGDYKIITSDNINSFYGYNASKTISVLIKEGFLTRVKNGIYYIHDFGENDISIGPNFFIDYILDGTGFIGYGAALTYYDLLEQFYNKNIIVFNHKLPYNKVVAAGYDYTLTQSSLPSFGIRNILVRHKTVKITDIERSILDTFSNPRFSPGIKEVAKAFYEANDEKLIDYQILLSYLIQYPDMIKLSKVLGFFIDTFKMNVPNLFYNRILDIAEKSTYTHLESRCKDEKSVYNKKWKLITNAHENFYSIIKY